MQQNKEEESPPAQSEEHSPDEAELPFGEKSERSGSARWLRRSSQEKTVLREIRQMAQASEDRQRAHADELFDKLEHDRKQTSFTYRLRRRAAQDDDREMWGHRHDITEMIRKSKIRLLRAEKDNERMETFICARDILRVLSDADLIRLRGEFEGDESVEKDRFCEIMMEFLHRAGYCTTDVERERLEREIETLFYQIDYDGNGDVDWDEFTNYMMFLYRVRGSPSAGYEEVEVPATKDVASPTKTTPQEEKKQKKKGEFAVLDDLVFSKEKNTFVSKHAGGKSSIRYHPGRDLLQVLEKFDNSVKLTLFNGSSMDKIVDAELSSSISCVEYVSDLHQFVVMDHRWRVGVNSLLQHRTHGLNLTELHSSHILKPPLLMEYSEESKLLITGTSDGDIVTYPLQTMHRHWDPDLSVKVHPEPISAFVNVPTSNKVICASVFGGLSALDRSKQTVLELAKANENPHGIHSMNFLPETNLLVTGGHSPDLLLWMVVHGQRDPLIGKLSDVGDPHRGGVVSIWQDPERLPNIVVSTDGNGMMKMWDLRRMRCVSSTALYPSKHNEVVYHAHGMTSCIANSKLFVLGTSAQTHFSSVDEVKMLPKHEVARKEAARLLSSISQRCCLYDERNDAVVSSVNNDIYMYEWKTGRIQSYFNQIVPQLITAMTLDRRGRRIYVGSSDGQVLVLNATIGTVTFEFQRLDDEVALLETSAPASDALVAGATDGSIAVYDTDCLSSAPTSVFRIHRRLTSAALHPFSNMLVVGDVREVVYSFELRAAKISPAGEILFQRSDFDAKQQLTIPPSAPLCTTTTAASSKAQESAERNFATDRQLFEYMAQPCGECTVIHQLSPLSGFVMADTTSHLALHSTKPLRPAGIICARWDHYTPKAVVGGLLQSIVLSMTFLHECSPMGNAILLTGDDQGCVTIWDLEAMLADANIVDPSPQQHRHHEQQQHQSPRWSETPESEGSTESKTPSTAPTLSPSHCGESPRVRPLHAPVKVTAIAPKVRHCFLVQQSTSIIAVQYVPRDGVILCGLATGNCLILSTEGVKLGTFIADPKYKFEPPPNFDFHERAVEDAHRRRQSVGATSHSLWEKVKKSVRGSKMTTADRIMEVMTITRATARDVFKEEVQGGGGDSAARSGSGEVGGDAIYRVVAPTAAPPTSPREIFHYNMRMGITPTEEGMRSNLVHPSKRRARSGTTADALGVSDEGEKTLCDFGAEDSAFLLSGSQSAYRTPSDEAIQSEHSTITKEALENYLNPKLERLRLQAYRWSHQRKAAVESPSGGSIIAAKKALRRAMDQKDVPVGVSVEIPYSSFSLYPPSLAGALTTPQASMIPYVPLPYEPYQVLTQAKQFVAPSVLTGPVMKQFAGRPPPVVSRFIPREEIEEKARLDFIAAKLSRDFELVDKRKERMRALKEKSKRELKELTRKQSAVISSLGTKGRQRSLVASGGKDPLDPFAKWGSLSGEQLSHLLPSPREPPEGERDASSGSPPVVCDTPAPGAKRMRTSFVFPVSRSGSFRASSVAQSEESSADERERSGSKENLGSPLLSTVLSRPPQYEETAQYDEEQSKEGVTMAVGEADLDLGSLLYASAPSYPLQPSPYLTPGRPVPVLTPFLFGEGLELLQRQLSSSTSTQGGESLEKDIKSVDQQDDRMVASRRFQRALASLSRARLPVLHPDYVSVAKTIGSRDVKDEVPSVELSRTQTTVRPQARPGSSASMRSVGSSAGVKPLRAPSARPTRIEKLERLSQPRREEIDRSREGQFVKTHVQTAKCSERPPSVPMTSVKEQPTIHRKAGPLPVKGKGKAELKRRKEKRGKDGEEEPAKSKIKTAMPQLGASPQTSSTIVSEAPAPCTSTTPEPLSDKPPTPGEVISMVNTAHIYRTTGQGESPSPPRRIMLGSISPHRQEVARAATSHELYQRSGAETSNAGSVRQLSSELARPMPLGRPSTGGRKDASASVSAPSSSLQRPPTTAVSKRPATGSTIMTRAGGASGGKLRKGTTAPPSKDVAPTPSLVLDARWPSKSTVQ